MGMYDEFEFHDGTLRCPDGHAVPSAQTKDLDCTLAHFIVIEGIAFRPAQTYPAPFTIQRDGEKIRAVSTWKQVAELASELDGPVGFHSHCDECDPVVWEDSRGAVGRGWGRGHVQSCQPYLQWMVEFERGHVKKAALLTATTRAELRARLERVEGRLVLPDDDRVAKQEIARHHKDRKERGHR